MAVNHKKILKKTGSIMFAGFVVLVLLVSAGLAYTWWMGQQPAPAVAVVEEVGDVRPATVTARTMPPDAPVGVSRQMLTTPVLPGENASLTIKTNPAATCDITVTYGELGETESKSTDSGLTPKVADQYGMVTWTWTVESLRPSGTFPVETTCANEENSGYLRVDLTVGREDT
jgi:hypothetical protein